MPSEPSTQRQVPVVWVDPPDPRAQWSNAIISSFQPDEFIVTFGQIVPPVIVGPAEDQIRQIQSLDYVQAQILARIALNRPKMVELIATLQENLAQHDARMEAS